jgi:hypothetical protein
MIKFPAFKNVGSALQNILDTANSAAEDEKRIEVKEMRVAERD